ncbi:DNA helicase rad5 [Rhizophlyctis rosea]|nr:DNA helicase rad5 [Rhizophlyctis rosea]
MATAKTRKFEGEHEDLERPSKAPRLGEEEDCGGPSGASVRVDEPSAGPSLAEDVPDLFGETPIAVYSQRITESIDDKTYVSLSHNVCQVSGRREEITFALETVQVYNSYRHADIRLPLPDTAPRPPSRSHWYYNYDTYWTLNANVYRKNQEIYPPLEKDYVFRYVSDNTLAAPLHMLFPEVFPRNLENTDHSTVRYILALEGPKNNRNLLTARLEIYARHTAPPNLHLHVPARKFHYLLPDRAEPLQSHTSEYVIPGVEDAPVNQEDMSLCAIPATHECDPSTQPDNGFKLNLYDYQLRSLGWMKDVEAGNADRFYSPSVAKVGETFVHLGKETLHEGLDSGLLETNVRGGVIADKPGVGKTITTLALIHDRPFTTPESEYLYQFDYERFISKASVIFVPNNLCQQWETEILKCFGADHKLKIICLKGKASYVEVDFLDILTADIIIMSYSMLTNSCYKGSKTASRWLGNFNTHWDWENPSEVRRFVAHKKGSFALTWVHFHRIIFDEFHEISDKMAGIRDQIRMMSADHIWGLTGTPRLQDTSRVEFFAEILKLDPEEWVHNAIESRRFVINRVRRNEPDPEYPDPINETIWVQPSVPESVVYRQMRDVREANMRDLLMFCSHHQIADLVQGDMGKEGNLHHGALSIEQVVEVIQGQRVVRIADLEEKLEKHQPFIDEAARELEAVQKEKNESDQLGLKDARLKKRVDQATKYLAKLNGRKHELLAELNPIKSQYTFFANFTTTYLEKAELSCPVCLEDDMKDQNLAILPCGHCTCPDCAIRLCNNFDKSGTCPNCRRPFTIGQAMHLEAPSRHAETSLKGKEPEAGPSNIPDPELEGVDTTTFGSKLRYLVTYINRVLAQDPTHRIVVFIQWADLASLVSDALNSFKVSNVRLYGGWNIREKALARFRAGLLGDAADPVKVIILSATDSVSGLNLTEASHVVILHPFWDEVEEHAVGAEMQGVARCVRIGQRRRVRIARFVVRGSVEEELFRRRGGGDGDGEGDGVGGGDGAVGAVGLVGAA